MCINFCVVWMLYNWNFFLTCTLACCGCEHKCKQFLFTKRYNKHCVLNSKAILKQPGEVYKHVIMLNQYLQGYANSFTKCGKHVKIELTIGACNAKTSYFAYFLQNKHEANIFGEENCYACVQCSILSSSFGRPITCTVQVGGDFRLVD